MRAAIVALSAVALYFVWRFASVKLKHGASLEGVSWRMFYAAIVADQVYKNYGAEAVITSGADGTHKAESKHYIGDALDFRTWNVKGNETSVRSDLKRKLGRDYDVVLEEDHLHVEYDPKAVA